MKPIKITEQNFEKEVLESETPVIIDFFADWCMPCKMMAPVFESLSEEYEGKLKFCKVNVDEHPGLSSEFGIQGIPALVIVSEGKETGRIVGFASESSLKNKIEQIL